MIQFNQRKDEISKASNPILLLTLICSLFFSYAFSQKGFVSLDTILHQAILEPMYCGSENFVGKRIDGYENEKVLLTEEAAHALREVEMKLNRMGLGLKILDGYRPQQSVDHFVRWSEDESDTINKPDYYPNVSKSQLFHQGYIAEQSGHTRGSAVDLTLYDLKTGEELDMGSDVDYFGLISHPYSDQITEKQRKNRDILRKAMVAEGFAPLDTEWWHFALIEEPFPETYFTFPVK